MDGGHGPIGNRPKNRYIHLATFRNLRFRFFEERTGWSYRSLPLSQITTGGSRDGAHREKKIDEQHHHVGTGLLQLSDVLWRRDKCQMLL